MSGGGNVTVPLVIDAASPLAPSPSPANTLTGGAPGGSLVTLNATAGGLDCSAARVLFGARPGVTVGCGPTWVTARAPPVSANASDVAGFVG